MLEDDDDNDDDDGGGAGAGHHLSVKRVEAAFLGLYAPAGGSDLDVRLLNWPAWIAQLED